MLWVFYRCSLSNSGKFPLVLIYWEFLPQINVECQMLCCSIKMVIWLFSFILLQWWISVIDFQELCQLWLQNKLCLVMMYYPFCCCIWFASILLWIFVSIIHERYWFVIFFACMLLSSIDQSSSGLIKGVEKEVYLI